MNAIKRPKKEDLLRAFVYSEEAMNLLIRRMQPEDLPFLHELLSDARVMQYLEPPYSMEQTRQFLQQAGLSPAPLIYAVVQPDGSFIGYVICHAYDESSIEIGWVLKPSCWGKGHASALTKQLLDKAADQKKAAVIECVPEQAATRAIARKFGFSLLQEKDGLLVYRREIT